VELLQILTTVAVSAAIYLLFALGMSIVWGTMAILNFAHGSIFMFAAFVGYLVVKQVALPLVAVVLIAMLAGALLSVLMQILAFEPIMKKAKNAHAAELQLVIGGIGLSALPIFVAQRATLSNPFGYLKSTFTVEYYDIGGWSISNLEIIILVVGWGLGIGTALFLRRSRQGLALRSLGVDPEVSSLMGIDRTRMALSGMAFAGALAGLAGALTTFYLTSITPESGNYILLKAFAAIILGGVGSVAGLMIGVTVLAGAETAVVLFSSGGWVNAVAFGLLFLILVIRPQGVLGKKEVRRT
jgi:branched-chain amino acid transport system permease protein